MALVDEELLRPTLAGLRFEARRMFGRLPRITLGMVANPVADAVTWRRGRFLGYRIDVNHGFGQLLSDAVQLLAARSGVVTAAGELREAPWLSHREASESLRATVVRYVESLEWRPDVRLVDSFLHALGDRWEKSDVFDLVMAQSSLQLEPMLRFTLAHELAHVLLGHCEASAVDAAEAQAQELAADRLAIELVIADLDDTDATTAIRFPGGWGSLRDFAVVTALCSIALLLSILDAIERAALSVGLPHWRTVHPDAALRYRTIRSHCIERGLVGEPLFARYRVGLEPPDAVELLVRYMTLDGWCNAEDDEVTAAGGAALLALAAARLAAAEEGIERDPSATRRRLDPLRRALDEVQDEPGYRPVLVLVLVALAFCSTLAGEPADAETYVRMAARHLEILAETGPVPEVLRESVARAAAVVTPRGA